MNYSLPITCPACKNPDMDGCGGSFGGCIETAKRRCPKCGLVLLIIPMDEKYTYSVSARTNEEIQDRQELENELKRLEEAADSLRFKIRNS